jgi:hypothetical protein
VHITNLDSHSAQTICEWRCDTCHPFVASTDGMLAVEATKILQHPADLMANKQQQSYSAIMKHFRICIVITLVKAICNQRSSRLKNNYHYHSALPKSPEVSDNKFNLLKYLCTLIHEHYTHSLTSGYQTSPQLSWIP